MTEREAVRAPAPSGVKWMLAATLVSGVAGYLVTFFAYQALAGAGYVVFAAFWSALFLVVGVLFGLQQESTRATAEALRDADRPGRRQSSLWIFGAGAGLIVGAIVLVSSVLWAPDSLGQENTGLALQVALGSAANAVVATMSGALAGSQRWRLLAAVIFLDGILRLAAVSLVLSVSDDLNLLAWAVVLPFPLAIGTVFCFAPGVLRRLGHSPLRYRTLAVNSVHTVIAASATAILINGFPLVLAFYGQGSDKDVLADLMFAIMLTRAPILVPLMALQSYLVTRFTNDRAALWAFLLKAIGAVAAVMALLGAATWLWGLWAFQTFINESFTLPTAALVPLVVSSGFIGILCVTGPALLALGRHRAYAAGWVAASAVALAVLFVPIPIEFRAPLALSLGPVVGIIWHLLAIRQGLRAQRRP
ncbi:lipopolysaccharide biosynthesis protein [Microterricola viridarii]|uniref:Membrane protein involved in the export of O-antigen and teichoic acid n=1 Tax=Microterricola viridarii TaxID=412690 RepID=A0A1H1QZ39_9MICO|nr:hypothetical protein [Microterricola viridarii]SDS28757.1 Membrane protein involved in the export of O-antigen and teichoic acid [Microterricola viridarii]